MREGVSVIICCHNSAAKLGQTLLHLANQQIDDSLKAELIVIDNNSADSSSEVAKELWKSLGNPYPMRVLKENIPGLTFARQRGIQASFYNYLIFCDDDNWLSEKYLANACNFFLSDNNLAVIGGFGTPAFEAPPPAWFDRFKQSYAVGAQATHDAYLNTVYGAGMCVRKTALQSPAFLSVPLLLKDRTGKILSSGGDSEICMRLKILGYSVYYTQELKFTHFISKEKITWNYLKKLHFGFSSAYAVLNIYEKVISGKKLSRFSWLSNGLIHLLRTLKYSMIYLPELLKNQEGQEELLRLESWLIIARDQFLMNFRLFKLYNRLTILKKND